MAPWPHTGPSVHGTASCRTWFGGITRRVVGVGSHGPSAGSPTPGSATVDHEIAERTPSPGARTCLTGAGVAARTWEDGIAPPSLRRREIPP